MKVGQPHDSLDAGLAQFWPVGMSYLFPGAWVEGLVFKV